MSKVPLVEQSWGYTYLLFSWPSSTELTHGPSSRLTANGCKPFTCSVSATFLVFGDQTSWQTHQSPKRQVCQTYMYVQSSVSGGWLSSSTSDACQKVHQCTMFFKHLLNCSSASSAHQSLIGGESQEDHEAAGCMVFSRMYSSLHKSPGQRLIIVKDGECKGPLPTMCSDDDDDTIGHLLLS